MPVIVTASSKGGAGKSTMTLVLAQALDAMGATVTIIDADPNRPILRWRSGQSGSTVEVVGDVTEGSIIRVIREHSAVRQFVLVRPGRNSKQTRVARHHPGGPGTDSAAGQCP